MQIFHSYGYRGMGDIVSSTSYFLTNFFNQDSHIVFHLPFEKHGYKERMPSIMTMWDNLPYKLTYEVDCTGAYRSNISAIAHFERLANKDECKRLQRTIIPHTYWPCVKLWKANEQGPIAIYLNHEYKFLEPQEKFFDKTNNDFLLSLIDNENYFSLGKDHSFEENLEIMSRCRYAIGIEGGWTHVSNSMRVPYIICSNKANWVKKFHLKHPSLKIIETSEMLEYLVL